MCKRDDSLISMHWIPNRYALVKNNCKNTKIEQENFDEKNVEYNPYKKS